MLVGGIRVIHSSIGHSHSHRERRSIKKKREVDPATQYHIDMAAQAVAAGLRGEYGGVASSSEGPRKHPQNLFFFFLILIGCSISSRLLFTPLPF